MSETKKSLIIAATVLLAVVIFCFGTRFQMMAAAQSFIYIYDRITGRIWSVERVGGVPYDFYSKVMSKYEVDHLPKPPLKTIPEWRKDNPGVYKDVPDQALADRIYELYYSDMPREKFMAQVLRKPPPERPLGDPN
jgi:hypothetical protein